MPWNFASKKEFFEAYGYPAWCPGCKAAIHGTARQCHSDAYRQRLEGILHGYEKAKGARERIDQYIAKRIEEQDDGGVAKEAGTDEGSMGSSGGPKVTPDSRCGADSSGAIARTVPEGHRDLAGTGSSIATPGMMRLMRVRPMRKMLNWEKGATRTRTKHARSGASTRWEGTNPEPHRKGGHELDGVDEESE